MLEAEAVRIREILVAQGAPSPLLNVGASTLHFRTAVQPHIERELFGPLASEGVEIVHSDLKAGEGIDIVGDILDRSTADSLRVRRFRALICANLLEHVRDPAAAAAACEAVVGPGGLILATAPSSYPYHADPIDTGFRPTPATLAALFARSVPLQLNEVEGGTYADEIAARGSTVPRQLALTMLFALIAFAWPKSFRARTHRWFWYRRPFRVAIALVEVGPAARHG